MTNFAGGTPTSIKLKEQVDSVESSQWFARPSSAKAIKQGDATQHEFEAFVTQQGFQVQDLNAVELNAAFTEFKLNQLEKRLDQIESQTNRN